MNKRRNLILVADPDPLIQKFISIILGQDNFTVIDCSTGKQALCHTMSIKPDLIILESDLPDMSGFSFIRTVREWSKVPIIMLSSQTDDRQVIRALNSGANDYIIKPFNGDVLKARLYAALRSSAINNGGEQQLVNGDLKIDLVRHEVFLNNKLLSFTPKEYNLLRYFTINKGKMLLHADILKAVWGCAHRENIQYLRVFVAHIRDKIESDPSHPKYIITEVGVGYRMENLDINDDPYYDQEILNFV